MEVFKAQRGQEKKIQKLNPELARKIAAGEVIDRPHAVVRELMDNAIDSGANHIKVEISSGGIEKILVRDDGVGLSKEDLILCTEPHATSKINSEVDLLNIQSMGFRGEALSSIAAVSRLKIQSKQASSQENHGWQLEAEVGLEIKIEPSNIHEGSIVESQGLFANFPARRQFLKRPASEGILCRQVFIEKALPFIDIDFTFTSDGEKKLFFQKTSYHKERFAQALGFEKHLSLFHEIQAKDESTEASWQYNLVLADPSLARTDRKHIYIFVNNRKIEEYRFVQAIEYGCEGFFPNGLKPLAALFLEINPSLVDFNIHPAKKEARFKDPNPIHRAIHRNIHSFFRSLSFKSLNEENSETSENFDYELPIEFPIGFSKEITNKIPNGFSKNLEDTMFSSNSYSANAKRTFRDTNFQKESFQNSQSFSPGYQSFQTKIKDIDDENIFFRYFGIFDSLFLIVEKDASLYLIDQHAAHERILYNRFTSKKAERQNLLVPEIYQTKDENEDKYLESIQEELKIQGFEIEKKEEGNWEIRSIHSLWEGNIEELFDLLLEDKTKPSDILRNIALNYACKTAIKDNSYIDDDTAINLIKEAFALDDPHCPHGRPIWTIIDKKELFQRVKRS